MADSPNADPTTAVPSIADPSIADPAIADPSPADPAIADVPPVDSSIPSEVWCPRVTVVHAPGCHFCDDAQDALAELALEHPLDVELVDAGSPLGVRLVGEHRAGMFPLVLLDGAFFSNGRLPRRKLRAVLARAAGASAQPAVVPPAVLRPAGLRPAGVR